MPTPSVSYFFHTGIGRSFHFEVTISNKEWCTDVLEWFFKFQFSKNTMTRRMSVMIFVNVSQIYKHSIAEIEILAKNSS